MEGYLHAHRSGLDPNCPTRPAGQVNRADIPLNAKERNFRSALFLILALPAVRYTRPPLLVDTWCFFPLVETAITPTLTRNVWLTTWPTGSAWVYHRAGFSVAAVLVLPIDYPGLVVIVKPSVKMD